ncbi:hypothetical protein LXL04_019580 [Taraxacum kok-saghyz]
MLLIQAQQSLYDKKTFNIGRIETSNSKLVFWDLGGQSGLRSIWEKYYEEAHAVIFVVDASCPSRFEESKSALEKVLRHEDLQGAPLLILANKQSRSIWNDKPAFEEKTMLSTVAIWAREFLDIYMDDAAV